MNCNNIRKYFHAFLDGELNVEKNIEVLAHLDMCCECSTKIESERFLQKRVKDTVYMVRAPDYLKQSVLEMTENKPNIFTLFKEKYLLRRYLIPLTGLVIAIILLACFFVTQNFLKKNDILYLEESIYHKYAMKQLDPDIRSQNAESIVEYFREQANLNVTLPEIQENARLVGAALTKIKDVNIPTVFYMCDDIPMALFINCDFEFQSMYGTTIDSSKMKETMAGKMVVYTDIGDCGSCQIVIWKKADSQYVMVSMLESDKVIKILTEV